MKGTEETVGISLSMSRKRPSQDCLSTTGMLEPEPIIELISKVPSRSVSPTFNERPVAPVPSIITTTDTNSTNASNDTTGDTSNVNVNATTTTTTEVDDCNNRNSTTATQCQYPLPVPATPSNIILREDTKQQQEEQEEVILPPPENASDPDDYLLLLFETLCPGKKLKIKPAIELSSFFPVVSEEQMARYSMKVVNIARVGDAQALREFHSETGADSLDCFNRFGEGLLNMACRRGFVDMVNFLFSPDVNLNVRVRDDFGRTPLHDACWNPEPQLQICAWILQRDPSLFLVTDKRGYTPFQYARQSDWAVWCQFLFDNSHHLKALAQDEICETFQRT